MGSVYLATDSTVGQQVAVKLIRTELDGFTDSAAAQLALERFRQEASAVARLDHLHILQLNRYGEEQTAQGPRAFMIMQYRPEGSLWDWLRRRADFASGQQQPTQAEVSAGLPMNWPLGLEEATDYAQQAASALQYAHDRGIVHRDIKPANFLLRFDQHEKRAHLLLGDFGLAKVFTGGSSTQTILGTPTYMAPEQFEGAARPESDQYALAVMIYYLLAGRPPFEGDPMQLMRQHLSSPVPSITTINPQISPAINGVLVRALAKPMEQRFPSIEAFADQFALVAKQVQSGQSQVSMYAAASPVDELSGRIRPGRPGLSSAGQLSPNPLVLPGPAQSAAARGYNTPLPPMAYPPQTPYATPSPQPQMNGGMYGAQNQFTNAGYANMYTQQQQQPFSPMSGRLPGYQQQSGVGQGGPQVSRRGALGWILGGAVVVAAAGSAGVYFYLNSAQSGSSTVPGAPATPALHILKGHSASVTSVSLLADGSKLATGSLDQSVRLWSTADGSSTGTIQTGSAVNALAWSPDGSKLATGEADRSVNFWSASGSSIKHEAGWGAAIKSLAWRSDGGFLFFGTNGNGLHALQISNYKHYGHTSPLVFVNAIAISPNGSLLVLALESGRVYFADLANSWAETASIAPAHGAALSVAWSRDNSFVVVGYADGTAVVYDANTRNVKYLLKHKGAVYSVAWSPASTAATPILVSGAADGSVNIWNLQGQGQQIIYSGHSDAVLAVTWGATMLASASKDQTAILWQPPTF